MFSKITRLKKLKFSKIRDQAITWYQQAREEKTLEFWIVFAIATYTPVEEFVLKWVPVPIALIALLRFVPELILYGLIFYIIWDRKVNGEKLAKTPIDIFVIAFFIATFISMAINNSRLMPSLINMRLLWRYLSVYYIIVNIKIEPIEVALLLKMMRIMGFAQGILSSFQYFLPNSLNKRLFAPKSVFIKGFSKESLAAGSGLRGLKVGASFGTFGNAAVLSAFFLISIIQLWVWIYTKSPALLPGKYEWLETIALYFGLFATKKRAGLLLAFVIPWIVLVFQRRRKGVLVSTWFYASMAFVVFLYSISASVDTSFHGLAARTESIDLSSYFLQLFSPDYWEESSETSRLWVVKTVVFAVFKSSSWFGFGPDIDVVRESIREILTDGGDRQRIINIDPLEDVYWIAMLAFFGVVGLSLFFGMLFRLCQYAYCLIRNSDQEEYRSVGLIFCTLVITTLFYAFIERIFKLRAFSFYFWLIAGLVVNSYHNHISSEASLYRTKKLNEKNKRY